MVPDWVRMIACAIAAVCLIGMTSGCATSRADLMPQHFGFRPDEPLPPEFSQEKKPDLCTDYREYIIYAQRLQEAYHSRATQNRGWIYVAAILGLGAAAATGGLAAASAAGVGTLALLGISGGFAAGFFGTLDNEELAKMYTLSANNIDKALQRADAHFKGVGQVQEAKAKLTRLEKRAEKAEDKDKANAEKKVNEAKTELADAKERAKDAPLCVDASLVLRAGVSRTRTKLELLRTRSAAGALARAHEEKKALDEIIKQFAPPSEESEEEPAPPTN